MGVTIRNEGGAVDRLRAAEWLLACGCQPDDPADRTVEQLLARHRAAAKLSILSRRTPTNHGDDQPAGRGGEPAIRLRNQGMILGPDGQKMSKSRGNVVAPDEVVDRYGADTFRCYLMFIGPWHLGGSYNPKGIEGIARWLNRVWSVVLDPPAAGKVTGSSGGGTLSG